MLKLILLLSSLFSIYYIFFLQRPSQNPSPTFNFSNKQLQYGDQRHYKLLGKHSKGKAGQVFLAQHLPSNDTVAFKLFSRTIESLFLTEISIYSKLYNAPNMLLPRDLLRQKGKDNTMQYGIVFDYFEAQHYRTLFPRLNKLEIKKFIYQVLCTLNYAHNQGIMHRDIKPLNILMNTENMEAKVIDWGSADYFIKGQRKSVRVGSLNFKAPELLLGYEFYDYAVDIWSSGCLLAEMVFVKMHFFQGELKREFNEKELNEQLEVIARVRGSEELREYAEKYRSDMRAEGMNNIGVYEKVSFETFINEENKHLVDNDVIDLLEKMLEYDHDKRVTASEALKHKYFDDMRQEILSL